MNDDPDLSRQPNTAVDNGSIQSDEDIKPGHLSSGHLPSHPDPSAESHGFAPQQTQSNPPSDASTKIFDDIINSEIGVSTLLNRLKQSVASARDFAAFMKKRSNLEEEQAQGLKKLCRTTHDSVRRPDNRQGSYARQFDEIVQIHERMADNGMQFALSLHQMHEDLQEMAANADRGRKHWKQSGLNAEKRAQESEAAMEKAKAKYDSLAEDHDRARTGDRQSGKKFGLKGPKSAAQYEEDLLRKVQAADADYSSKVQAAQAQRQELLNTLRPQAVRSLQDLISEIDSALTLQLQKFASFNEKLLLSNGLSVSPLNQQGDVQASRQKSLRGVVHSIDNEGDLRTYVLSFSSQVPAKPSEIRYERHPTLAPQQHTPPPAARQQPNFGPPPSSFPMQAPPPQQYQPPPPHVEDTPSPAGVGPAGSFYGGPPAPSQPLAMRDGAPQLPAYQLNQPPAPQATPPAPSSRNGSPFPADLPPLKPVFGVSLDSLFKRDGSAVPLIVYQCIQAIDMFGLDVEGIYRLSGTASHIAKIKALFDNDATKVDFRDPEFFLHDVNSVAGVLKQFFRDLPDPLLTNEQYAGFIEAARIDDDLVRRDSMHAIINNLPDPNYATLRAVALHLYRVQEHQSANRMNSSNLAICLGPTLMGSNTSQHIADAGWQVRVLDTILQNTYQIFDDD